MTEDKPRPGKVIKKFPLKIYRIQRNHRFGKYNGIVVVAKNPTEAKKMFPMTKYTKSGLICEFMGYPKKGRREGIVLLSKN